MLLKANLDEFQIKYVFLKSMSLSVNASYAYLSESIDGMYKKTPVSFATARRFRQIHKVTEFIVPTRVSALVWRGQVIALDRLIRAQQDPTVVPTPVCDISMYFGRIKIMVEGSQRQWYFDGTYIYKFLNRIDNIEDAKESQHSHADSNSVDEAVRYGQLTSSCGNFRAIPVMSINLSKLSFLFDQGVRYCLAYVASNRDYGISAPIWKSLGDSGLKTTKKVDSDESTDTEFTSLRDISGCDEYHAVSLMYIMTVAKGVATEYGYRSIEPIGLPRLMIKYNTVNLMALPGAVLKTTPIEHMPPSQVFAWLLGLQARSTNFEQMATIRRLLKYLASRGMIRKDSSDVSSVLKINIPSTKDIPLIKLA